MSVQCRSRGGGAVRGPVGGDGSRCGRFV